MRLCIRQHHSGCARIGQKKRQEDAFCKNIEFQRSLTAWIEKNSSAVFLNESILFQGDENNTD
jgi:hypothetical protein